MVVEEEVMVMKEVEMLQNLCQVEHYLQHMVVEEEVMVMKEVEMLQNLCQVDHYLQHRPAQVH